jgi:hypothetical protein
MVGFVTRLSTLFVQIGIYYGTNIIEHCFVSTHRMSLLCIPSISDQTDSDHICI